jgi:hypothetical protein
MKAGRRTLPVMLVFLAGAAALRAQADAYVSGTILDPSDSGVPDAVVNIVNEDSGFRRETRSRPDGGYMVTSLWPGMYKITVRKDGFRSMVRFGVRLARTVPARVDFTLSIGSVQETITVEGTPRFLDREDASVRTQVGRAEIERLPLSGRSLLGLLELATGTIVTPATRGEAGQFTSNGQRPNSNYFLIDGVSANTGVSGGGLPAQSTGGSLPGLTALGSMHSLISLEALEEFRVQTAALDPEFGKLPGAQVSLVSRSGSNEYHGSLFYGLRHEKGSANDWFANQNGEGRAPLRMHDFSANVGGPVWRNHTFFFVSYEDMRLRQPFAWQTPVPSLAARNNAPDWAQLVLRFFPAPNGPDLGQGLAQWTGRNNRPSRLDVGSIRLDQAITPRMTLFGRYNDTPSANQFGNTQISELNLRSRSITAGLNLRIRPDLIFDLRANASVAQAHTFWKQQSAVATPACQLEPVTQYLLHVSGLCDMLLRFSIAGVGQVVAGREGDRQQTQYNIAQTLTWNVGSHTLRVGADYRRLAPDRRDATGTLSVIADTLEDFTANRNVWIASSAPEYSSVVLKELSAFAQDTWRIAPRLTVTYGLRWEYSPPPVSNLPAYYLDPTQGIVLPAAGAIWPQRFTNIAPRLGFALRPGAPGRTVVRAGAGLYYDSSLSIGTDVINGGPLSVRQYGSGRYAPFSSLLSFGFTPDLRLPVVEQHSVSVEHGWSQGDVISAGYVGSIGRHLIRREIGGPGSSTLDWLALATNHGTSRYDALEMQYRRRIAKGLQSIISYTWSHSLDNSSSDAMMYWAGPGVDLQREHASSDFDVRHALTAAFTYEIPGFDTPAWRWLRGWAVDGMLRVRTGFSMNVLNAEEAMGISLANAFRPNLISGQPVWVADAFSPGGRRINRAAFQTTPDLMQGDLGRNALTGFGMSQIDLALRRSFIFGEKYALEFRLEAFNALNHPNFADPVNYLTNPLFGSSPSMLNLMLGTGSPGSGLAPLFQAGGARSIQASLRFTF